MIIGSEDLRVSLGEAVRDVTRAIDLGRAEPSAPLGDRKLGGRGSVQAGGSGWSVN